MVSKITLPPWPERAPAAAARNVTDVVTVPPRALTRDERDRMIEILDYLNLSCGIGLNRLMRAVNLSSDLKSIFATRKVVHDTLVDEMANAVGLTTKELWEIETLTPTRLSEMREHLKQTDLIEPVRSFMTKRRQYIRP
jgi:hypothetical protein